MTNQNLAKTPPASQQSQAGQTTIDPSGNEPRATAHEQGPSETSQLEWASQQEREPITSTNVQAWIARAVTEARALAFTPKAKLPRPARIIQCCPKCGFSRIFKLAKFWRCGNPRKNEDGKPDCAAKFRTPDKRPAMKSYRRRRSAKDYPIPTQADVLWKIRQVKKPSHRALCAILYLTGGRINEVIRQVRRNQVCLESVDKDGQAKPFLVFRDVPTLKRRGPSKMAPRSIVVPIDKEGAFVECMREWLDGPEFVGKPQEYLFRFGYGAAYKYFREAVGWWPHFFRHCRTSHLLSVYGMDSEAVRLWHFWTDSRHVATYGHLNWRDLARKMM